MPRPLSSDERQLLLQIVEVVPHSANLLNQIESAQYDEAWFDGSQSFSILVSAAVPPYSLGGVVKAGRQVGPGATVHEDGSRPTNDNFVGEVFLWLIDGRIADLEYCWVTDDMPDRLPRLDQLVR